MVETASGAEKEGGSASAGSGCWAQLSKGIRASHPKVSLTKEEGPSPVGGTQHQVPRWAFVQQWLRAMLCQAGHPVRWEKRPACRGHNFSRAESTVGSRDSSLQQSCRSLPYFTAFPGSCVSAEVVPWVSVLNLWVTLSSLPFFRAKLLSSVPVITGKESPFSPSHLPQVPLVAFLAAVKTNLLGTFMFCSQKFSCIPSAFLRGDVCVRAHGRAKCRVPCQPLWILWAPSTSTRSCSSPVLWSLLLWTPSELRHSPQWLCL